MQENEGLFSEHRLTQCLIHISFTTQMHIHCSVQKRTTKWLRRASS